MSSCKADEILRKKAYLQGTSLTKVEDNAADGRFSSACCRNRRERTLGRRTHLMELIFIAMLLGLLPAYIASAKGKNFLLWWFYGTFLFVFAIFHAIAMKPAEENLIFYGRRYCPHCEKIVDVGATSCEHCGKEIEPLPRE
jgi:hypothetical protein